jgi:hypothetical protein
LITIGEVKVYGVPEKESTDKGENLNTAVYEADLRGVVNHPRV